MGRFILTYLCMLFLFSSCTKEKDRNSLNCNPFCEGEEWYVQEFSADPYPSFLPPEKSQIIAALEEELFFWKLIGNDTLTLNGKDNKSISFKCFTEGDTLMLTSHENQNTVKLIIRKKSSNCLNLKLIGLIHADIQLQKQSY